MKVVISGSRSIKSLPPEAIKRINTIINLGADILVGDAPGVDALVQSYLEIRGYPNVTVYFAYGRPRNYRDSSWNAVRCSGNYSDRDKVMCGAADYGLAIWDGCSRGTLANTKRVPTRIVRA